MKAPAGSRHHRNGSCRDADGLYAGTAVRIRKRQSDLVRRVRTEEENAAREHVGAVVVDPNERQRRPPSGGPGDSKIHGRCASWSASPTISHSTPIDEIVE